MNPVKVLFVISFLVICTFSARAEKHLVLIKGKMVDEKKQPVPGVIFVDTMLNGTKYFGGNAGIEQIRQSNRLEFAVGDNGLFELSFDGKKPYYLFFVSEGKRTVSIFFPETNETNIDFKVMMFIYHANNLREESQSSVVSNSPRLNEWFAVYAFSNYSYNTAVWRYMDSSIKYKMLKGTYEGFSYDLSDYYKTMLQMYSRTKDRKLKNYILLNLSFLNIGNKYPVEEKYMYEVIKETPADDYLWLCDLGFKTGVISGLGGFKKNGEFLTIFLENLYRQCKMEPIKILTLYYLVYETYEAGLPVFKKFYNELVELYPESQQAKAARKKMGPSLIRKKGAQVPEFSFINLKDKVKKHSKQSMLGKIYLIDFWATWCGPCILQFPHFEKLYKQYQSKGFEILSVSVDKEEVSVNNFTNKRYKMPWLNGFAGELTPQLSEAFEIWAIPRLILVDEEGKIISAERYELEGDALENLIKKLVNKTR